MMDDKDSSNIYENALKLAQVGKFQESLNLMNEVFLFHPEGAIAYKHYFRGLVETNLENRMRDLERAKESFKFLLESVNENKKDASLSEIVKTMNDHWEGLEGARRSTIEEYNNRVEYGEISSIKLGADE